jgi:hypothetical protein
MRGTKTQRNLDKSFEWNSLLMGKKIIHLWALATCIFSRVLKTLEWLKKTLCMVPNRASPLDKAVMN